MESTSDFDTWLETVELEDTEDQQDLRLAVETRKDCGRWFVKTAGEKTFVECGDNQLLLLSEKARKAFLAQVDRLKVEGPDDLEAGYRLNMDNPHA